MWRLDDAINNDSRIVENYKDGWVSAYREVIKRAAELYDIPAELLAGVAWIEVGGAPAFFDDAGYLLRSNLSEEQWNGLWNTIHDSSIGSRVFDYIPKLEQYSDYRPSESTSFGDLSMQLRVAALTLGIPPEMLDSASEKSLAKLLKNPRLCIMLAARHLADLKQIDFPNTPSDELTQDEIIAIANRYNIGSEVSYETAANHFYGQRFRDRLDIIKELLYE